jgi:hypothetical protein
MLGTLLGLSVSSSHKNKDMTLQLRSNHARAVHEPNCTNYETLLLRAEYTACNKSFPNNCYDPFVCCVNQVAGEL